MASLNTLRTRGGIIVSIVIGIALLAFILSDSTIIDFVTGGSSARDPKLGEIAGRTVKYSEFMNERNRLEEVNKFMYGRTDDYQATSDATWETLILKNSYLPGLERLGLAPSEAEKIDMTTGAYLSPVITSTFVNRNTGMFDPAELSDFVDNLSENYSYENSLIWNYIKEQTNNQRVMSKYFALVSRGMYVTDLEIRAAMQQAASSVNARVVGQPYAVIPDSAVNITNQEIKNYYNEHKELFRQDESRDIEYVLFEIKPSQADFDNAKKRIDELAQGFAAAENPLQFARLNSPDDRTPARWVRQDAVDPEIADAIFTEGDAMYGPVLKGDTYTIARLGDSALIPDTVQVSHVLLPMSERLLADSLLGALRGGAGFAEIAREYSRDPNTSMTGGDMGPMRPEDIESDLPELTQAILDNPAGSVFLVEAPYGIQIVRIDRKTTPVRKVKVATVKYIVKASTATQNLMAAEAQNFYNAAKGSVNSFDTAVGESILVKRTAHLNNTDRNVSGLDNSRDIIRWAFNNKRGTVSEPMTVGLDYYAVAVVTAVNEYGYKTADEAAPAIRNVLLREKKYQMLLPNFESGDLEMISSVVGESIKDLESVRFQEFYLQGVGVEPALAGAISTARQTGAISKPVRGNTGVYAFVPTEINNNEEVLDEIDQRLALETAAANFLDRRVTQALMEASRIKDARVKYM